MFETDTAVEPAGDGWFTAVITDRWHGLEGRPLGGYVLATALRALREITPHPDLFVASAFFLNPVGPGPVEIRAELARNGRGSTTGEARLYQDGRENLRAVATFADLTRAGGPVLVAGAPPALPPPRDAIDMHEGGPPPTASIADRVEYRVRPPLGRREPGGDRAPETSLWMRLKEGGGQDLLSIPFLADAAPPAVMQLGATGSTTLELTVHVRARPVSAWVACLATTRYIINGYHEEDFEIWDETGRLIAQSRQLAKLPKTDTVKISAC